MFQEQSAVDVNIDALSREFYGRVRDRRVADGKLENVRARSRRYGRNDFQSQNRSTNFRQQELA